MADKIQEMKFKLAGVKDGDVMHYAFCHLDSGTFGDLIRWEDYSGLNMSETNELIRKETYKLFWKIMEGENK